MPQPRILAPAPLDDDEYHAGRCAGRPPGPLDPAEDEGIEESGLHFEVVRRVTGYGDKNAVVMDDCEQYFLARVVEWPPLAPPALADGGAESRLARVRPRYRPGARHA